MAGKNINWNISRVTELVKEKVNMMGESEWEKLCTKVKTIEEDYKKSDNVVDLMTETFIICVEDDGSDDDFGEGSSSEDGNDDESMRDDEVASTSASSSSGFQVIQDYLIAGVTHLV